MTSATTLTTFAAWPKLVHGRVTFVAPCPCGEDTVWEQIGQWGVELYEISCPCADGVPAGAAEPAA